jgi:hypothetical protein
MYGYLAYEVAKQRMAEQQRAARQAREVREVRRLRAAARGRHGRDEAAEAIATPLIPDFADQMFGAALDAVPAPRREAARGRHARTNR